MGASKLVTSAVRRSGCGGVFFTTLTALSYPLVKMIVIHKDKWNWQNTDNGWRDTFSSRYAFRHSYNEVLEWFEDQEFSVVGVQSPAAYRRLFGKQLYGVGIMGSRVGSAETATEREWEYSGSVTANTR